MKRICGKQTSFKPKLLDQVLRNRDFIGFLVGDHFVSQDQLLVSKERREHLDHLLILEMVETSPDGLAIEANLRERGWIKIVQVICVGSEC